MLYLILTPAWHFCLHYINVVVCQYAKSVKVPTIYKGHTLYMALSQDMVARLACHQIFKCHQVMPENKGKSCILIHFDPFL